MSVPPPAPASPVRPSPRPRRRGGRGLRVLAAALAAFVLLLVVVLLAHRERPHVTRLPSGTPGSANGSTVPAGDIVFDSNRSGGHYEIYVMRPDGSGAHRLTHTADSDSWWPRVSPDRTRVLFYCTPAGVYDTDYTKTSLWVMNADGTGAAQLLPAGAYGWALQGHAEWSPDGRHLVMFGGRRSNPEIYVTDASGRDPRAVTDRGGPNVDPSWSPDGRTVVFVGCPSRFCTPDRQEIYTVPASGGDPNRLTDDDIRDNDPCYSPDGARIAWLSETSTKGAAGVWNIRISNADGSDVHLVTDDDNVNSRPQWSADGAWIYFHRLVYGKGGFGIWAVHPDGSGLRDLTAGQPGADGYPGT